MVFTAKPDEQKDFGSQPTTTISQRIPENLKETIKPIIDEYVRNFREDNIQKIKSVKDNIKETISIYQDVYDYIEKEESITNSKYMEIFNNHNIDLINDLIAEFPIERKTPIKTLTEEKREKREEELKKKKEREKLRFKTGWKGFGVKYTDYLILEELDEHYNGYNEKKNRALRLWRACYQFYGEEANKRETSYKAPPRYRKPVKRSKELAKLWKHWDKEDKRKKEKKEGITLKTGTYTKEELLRRFEDQKQ